MDKDEAIYQLEQKRREEEEQEEAMLTRRANERAVYARDGLHTGRRYGIFQGPPPGGVAR